MEVLMLPIDQIKPYQKNPRKNAKAIPEVVKSLKEFGFRQPLVVDKDMILVVGHTRLLAAKELGMKEVPVHIAKDLTPAQLKAYRIKDNRSGERAEWDRDLLLTEMDEIVTLDDRLGPAFLDFEIDQIDEPADYKTFDLSKVTDEFVLTLRGPLTSQDEVREKLKKFDGAEGFVLEVSHVKRSGA